jgi:glycosyltransferase involved in cell wall biosynthesis
MNILLVIADLGLGGAQQVVINLANEFIRQQHRVWIFDVDPNLREKGMVDRIDRDVNLVSENYKDFKLSKKDKLVDFIFNKFSVKTNLNKLLFKYHEKNLQRILSKTKIHFVNSHVCWADYFVYSKLKNFHNRWIISLHSSYLDFFSQYKNDSNYQVNFLIKAMGVLYLTKKELERIELHYNFKIKNTCKTINGVPNFNLKTSLKRENLGLKKTDFVLLCASRAIIEKGWYELAEAVNSLKDNYNDIKLIFAGDGPIKEEISKKYKTSNNISFLGFRNDIIQLIKVCDLVVLPSYSEALSTTLIEAAINKKPILATNVGEVERIIYNQFGSCGMLLMASKGADLAKEITVKVLDIKEGRTKFDIKAFEEAKKNFSINKMAKNYLKFYSKITTS